MLSFLHTVSPTHLSFKGLRHLRATRKTTVPGAGWALQGTCSPGTDGRDGESELFQGYWEGRGEGRGASVTRRVTRIFSLPVV